VDLTKYLLKHNFEVQFYLRNESEDFFQKLKNNKFSDVSNLVISYDLKYLENSSEFIVTFLYPRDAEKAELLKTLFFNAQNFNANIRLYDSKTGIAASIYQLELVHLIEFDLNGNDRAYDLLETTVKFRCILKTG
jgi:hypothetical protein